MWLRLPLALTVLATTLSVADSRAKLAERVRSLTRQSVWTLVRSVPLDFRTHHPQGMVRIGDEFYLSSVEIKTPTKRFAQPVEGYDRDAGEGAGHLFRFDLSGKLRAQTTLGEGTIYHPGGIDYDGAHIWVPVAEYRPNSRSIVYRIDPRTMKATEAVRVADHIGAIVHDTVDRALHGVSWGSRRFYRWPLTRSGSVTASATRPEPNPSHYVDYQDCHYVGKRQMLCSGVTELRQNADAKPFRLGGLELIDLRDRRPRHQVPVLLWTKAGAVMTQNPVWMEATGDGLRAYFVPEDNESTLYIYDTQNHERRTKK